MTTRPMPNPLPMTTRRGAATRARIIEAASQLVAEHGVAGTRLDDIMAASRTSKSQIYHYFQGKDAVINAVVEARTRSVLQFQKTCLAKVETLAHLREWRDQIIVIKRVGGTSGGCPIGSLASELADRSDVAREILAGSFEEWESYLCAALRAMQRHGELDGEADTAALATAIIASLQGGLLMAQTKRSTQPLEAALDQALHYVSIYRRSDRGRKNRSRSLDQH